MPGGYAFVAEVAVHLIDPFQTSDEKTFQIKLRRDAQENIHVIRIVLGFKRPSPRAACHGLEHRRFDFKKIALIKKTTDHRNDTAALDENIPHR